MPLETKEREEVGQLVHRLREVVDQYGDVPEFAENLKKIGDRLDALEAKAGRMPLAGGGDEDEQAEREAKKAQKLQKRAVIEVLRKGERRMARDLKAHLKAADAPEGMDFKALSISDDTLGGYFALPEIVTDELIKAVTLVSPFRALANVRTISANSVKLPVRTSPTAAAWTSETGTRTASTNPAFGMKEVSTHEMYALMLMSRQLLEDSVFDFEAEMRDEFSTQMAKLEGAAFINGDGNGKPYGILSDSNLTNSSNYTAAGGATLTTADPIITLVHDLKSAYAPSARLIFNRKTLGVIRKLKDNNGRYIWEPGLPNGNPPQIVDLPYTEMPDMPDIASNAFPIAVGDWKRCYTVVDRSTVAVQRLDELYATSAQIGLLAYKRVGGQVVLTEAARLLHMA
jgi:HK97 family phage major capsid protein